MSKCKQTFVTTKVNGVFALKLSKELPVTYYPGIDVPQFRDRQSNWNFIIYETDNEDKRTFIVYAKSIDGKETITYEVPEYSSILVDKGRVSVVDEPTFLESYDLGNKALTKRDYDKLKDLAMKRLKTENEIIDYFMSQVNPGVIDIEHLKALVKMRLKDKYTDKHFEIVRSHFDNYSLTNILRNRAVFGPSKELSDLLAAGVVEKANYTGWPGATKVTDKILEDFSIEPTDFTKDGWYRWSERFLRTQATNEIAEKLGF